MTEYETAVSYIMTIPYFSEESTFEAAGDFYAWLRDVRGYSMEGHRIFHVAGTNGKGSVCAFLTSIHLAMGKSVCTFVSPHLTDIRERILINNSPIEKDKFLEAFNILNEEIAVYNACRDVQYRPCFFQFMFFMLDIALADMEVEAVILETGMGGRLDATNIPTTKAAAIITSISLDHCQYLGNTLAEIAAQKAAIMRPGVPLIAAAGREEAYRVIKAMAEEAGAALYPVKAPEENELRVHHKVIDFCYKSIYDNNVDLRINSPAMYQAENCSLAFAAAEAVYGADISPAIMKKAALDMFWPGRMEELAPGVFADGAHNVDGMEQFLKVVKGDSLGPDGRRLLLFSAVHDKQIEEMADSIIASGLFDVICLVPVKGNRSTPAEELAGFFRDRGIDICGKNSAEEGYYSLLSRKRKDDLVYVCGSLYLIGELKTLLLNGNTI